MTVLACLCVPLAAQARIKIEDLQRQFQARYVVVTEGGTVKWPDCACGPAPAFPKEDFYGHDLDDAKAMELVSDLQEKFYGANKIYSSFVNIQALENSENITYFTSSDFPPATNVTMPNFHQIFTNLQASILKLHYLPVTAGQAQLEVQTTCARINNTTYAA
jgi:hypothetical protein